MIIVLRTKHSNDRSTPDALWQWSHRPCYEQFCSRQYWWCVSTRFGRWRWRDSSCESDQLYDNDDVEFYLNPYDGTDDKEDVRDAGGLQSNKTGVFASTPIWGTASTSISAASVYTRKYIGFCPSYNNLLLLIPLLIMRDIKENTARMPMYLLSLIYIKQQFPAQVISCGALNWQHTDDITGVIETCGDSCVAVSPPSCLYHVTLIAATTARGSRRLYFTQVLNGPPCCCQLLCVLAAALCLCRW